MTNTRTIDMVAAERQRLYDAGYRPIPVLTGDKRPLGTDWVNSAKRDPPAAISFQPVPHALNSGILCDGLRAIDLDIDDKETAARARAIIVQRFGEAPIRMRANSSRCLLLYRAADGTPPKLTLAGNKGKIEVLGKGQQFVAFGTHPTGAHLEWFPDAPGQEPLHALPAITEADLQELLAQLAPIIDARPPDQKSNGTDHTSSEPQADPLRIAAALASIPNGGAPDWERWNYIGMAVWRATGGSAAGWEAWNAWSQRNGSYDTQEARERWSHYSTSPPTQVGAGTIFYLAQQEEALRQQRAESSAGFKSADDDFESTILDPRKWTAPAPLRQWIVADWIPRGYVTGMYGDGGVGKSIVLQQLLTSTATALPWLGMDLQHAGRAFGFMCEDDQDELNRRQEAINRAYGIGPEHLEFLRYSARVGFDNLLMLFNEQNQGKPTPLYDRLIAFLESFPPALVVIDTLADTFGGDELKRAHARQFVQGVGGNIARKFNCGVVIAAHPSASGIAQGTGTGGSTAWSNTVRSRLYLTQKEGDGDGRTLSRMKANYAPTKGEILLEWRHGCFALSNIQDPQVGVTWADIRAIFAEIERAWNGREPWSTEPQTKKWGRYLPLWIQVTFGYNEKEILKLLHSWLAGGFLKMDELDAHSKMRGLRVMKHLQPGVASKGCGG